MLLLQNLFGMKAIFLMWRTLHLHITTPFHVLLLWQLENGRDDTVQCLVCSFCIQNNFWIDIRLLAHIFGSSYGNFKQKLQRQPTDSSSSAPTPSIASSNKLAPTDTGSSSTILRRNWGWNAAAQPNTAPTNSRSRDSRLLYFSDEIPHERF